MNADFSLIQPTVESLGFSSLRPPQVEPVISILQGEDSFIIMPTGGGKSLLYVVPTLVLGCKTLIFSPLVSLIQDQVEKLWKWKLSAGAISSAFSQAEINRTLAAWESGELNFLFIAPERLSNDKFQEVMKRARPDIIAVDEIHVASEHSDNFRPDYCKIAPFISEIQPSVFIGLTATFSKNIENDVRRIFNAQNTRKIVSVYRRTNLLLHSQDYTSDFDVVKLCNEVDGPVIVYCSTVRMVTELYDSIGKMIKGGALIYHGQMSSNQRESNQSQFMSGRVRVVIATNSFGMGIDKEDVRAVIFRTYPGSLEELYQGFGRGGRDGKNCKCTLLCDSSTIDTQNFFIDIGHPSEQKIKAFFNKLSNSLDENGLCYQSGSSLCQLCGFSNAYSGAILSILKGAGVIEYDVKSSSARIELKKPHLDKRLSQYLDAIQLYGIEEGKQGEYYIDIDFLSEQLGKSPATVKKNLSLLDEGGYVSYKPPPRSKPIKISGKISDVDFERLKEKRNEAVAKLNMVLEFPKKADDEKHSFLEDYFKDL